MNKILAEQQAVLQNFLDDQKKIPEEAKSEILITENNEIVKASESDCGKEEFKTKTDDKESKVKEDRKDKG